MLMISYTRIQFARRDLTQVRDTLSHLARVGARSCTGWVRTEQLTTWPVPYCIQ